MMSSHHDDANQSREKTRSSFARLSAFIVELRFHSFRDVERLSLSTRDLTQCEELSTRWNERIEVKFKFVFDFWEIQSRTRVLLLLVAFSRTISFENVKWEKLFSKIFFSVHSFNFDCEFAVPWDAVQQLRPLKDRKSRKSKSIMLHREGRKMQTKSKKMRN